MRLLARHLPILDWGRRYDRETAAADLVAAVIVTIMLIPQSLAYAMLAGLPPETGLYASVLPIVAYALFGTSRALAVGPVAVASTGAGRSASNIHAYRSPRRRPMRFGGVFGRMSTASTVRMISEARLPRLR